jgi:hypothetical protein
MIEETKTRKNTKRYEVSIVYEDYSESTYLIRRKGAEKLFEEKKQDFQKNKEIKKILFNEVSMKDEEIITIPLERIEREENK